MGSIDGSNISCLRCSIERAVSLKSLYSSSNSSNVLPLIPSAVKETWPGWVASKESTYLTIGV